MATTPTPFELDYNFTLLLMIFLRMSGCILFNPIFGRKNLPRIFLVALTLFLTMFAYPLVPMQEGFEITSSVMLVVVGVKEMLLGLMLGFIIQVFYSVLIIAGELIDMQIGISMSKIYDPASNISMPVSASYYNILMMFLFFAVNGHLTLIRIFTQLATLVPYGDQMIGTGTYQTLISLFSSILVFALQMSMPMLAVELITEMAVGLIMKAVPQIDVFTINLQLKIIMGFVVLLVLVPPMASFLDHLITLMFDNINLFISTFQQG